MVIVEYQPLVMFKYAIIPQTRQDNQNNVECGCWTKFISSRRGCPGSWESQHTSQVRRQNRNKARSEKRGKLFLKARPALSENREGCRWPLEGRRPRHKRRPWRGAGWSIHKLQGLSTRQVFPVQQPLSPGGSCPHRRPPTRPTADRAAAAQAQAAVLVFLAHPLSRISPQTALPFHDRSVAFQETA